MIAMARTCNLVINGRTVKANIGETLVDAGLGGWVVIPHDCCSGQCETCRVNVVRGSVDDQGTGDGSTVLACLATVAGDAEIEFDYVPSTSKRVGTVTKLSSLGPEVVEVAVELTSAFQYRPGQYFSVKFSGFPARDLSATLHPDGSLGPRELVFHFRRYPGGIVSGQLGATIREGHRVLVRGPYGQAFLREGPGPVILVAGGTGWAPIWSIACAARRDYRDRELFVIAGARDMQNLYMRRSLDRLMDERVLGVIATVESGAVDPVMTGRPTHYLPDLGVEDTVYVAGPPGLVNTIKRKARDAHSRCYADPFLPGVHKVSLIDRFMRMLRSSDGTNADLGLAPRPVVRAAKSDAERARRTGETAPVTATLRELGEPRSGSRRRESGKLTQR
jgi:3-phenylpropionate/trans-cinnamate dioxygenase ferredoxin reductase subunit